MVNIIGDSHTRSFGNLKRLNAYYLGKGLEFNLQTNKIENIKSKIVKITPKPNDINYLYFGEPNVRFQLARDHHIFKNHKIDEIYPKVDKTYLNKVVDNYCNLVDNLHFSCKILTPTTTFPPSIPAMSYLVDKLKDNFGELVVDIFSDTLEDGVVKRFLRMENFNYDPIHCNTNIVRIFENKVGMKFEYEQKPNQSHLGTIVL
jgi:hypothetical protein